MSIETQSVYDSGWTIMIYMAGDNNLSVEMAYALDEIRAVAKGNPNISVFVYYDGYSSDVPTLYGDLCDPITFYRSMNVEDKLIKRVVSQADAYNENSASMNNVLNFVDWCIDKDKNADVDGTIMDLRKQKKYAMIFSGHSFGFNDWGLFKDENADYHMTLSKLKWLFERITLEGKDLNEIAAADQAREKAWAEKHGRRFKPWDKQKFEERTTEILGKKIDILGFDSCEMSSIEIGSQFKGVAKTLVASEGSVPNAGWNYAQILLGELNGDAGPRETEVIAMSFVNEFIRQQRNFALADISVDMSAWNLKNLDKLENRFGVFAKSLLDCFNTTNPISYNQMRRLLSQVHWHCQTYSFEQFVDLGDLCGLLIREIQLLQTEIDPHQITEIRAVQIAAENVLLALRECVLITGFSGRDFQFSNGISLFFPWSMAAYECAQADYEELSFVRRDYGEPWTSKPGSIWNHFLKLYLSEITLRPADLLTTTDAEGNIVVDDNTESVVFESYNLVEKSDPPSISSSLDEYITDRREQLGRVGRRPPGDFRRPPGDFRRPPGDFKRPPGDFKRPPGDFRRPPGDFRGGSGQMNIFLSRFMKLKNCQSSWNHAGFRSRKAVFGPELVSPTVNPRLPGGKKIRIEIPRGATIRKHLLDVVEKILLLEHWEIVGIDEHKVSKIAKVLSGVKLAESRNASDLKRLSKSLDFESGSPTFSLERAVRRSMDGTNSKLFQNILKILRSK